MKWLGRIRGDMRRCDHCGETFETETAELRHLRDEHGGELGSIDRRRVASLDSGDATNPVVYAAGVGGLALVALVVYLVFFAGGSLGDGAGGAGDADPGADGSGVGATTAGTVTASGASSAASITPHDNGAVHYHGDITVTIDGRTLDFSQRRYQLQDDHFHFENRVGDRWHVHSRGVTLAYAMRTVGIDVTRHAVTFDGTTYRDSERGTRVVVEVNGDAVNPDSYVLQEGDTIRIVARTNGTA